MVTNFFLNWLLFFYLITLSSSLLLRITGEKKQYCFKKILYGEDVVKFNYIVSSQRPESIQCIFKNVDTNQEIFRREKEQSGDYSSGTPLPPSTYTLCFIPEDTNSYYLSFELYSLFESGIVNELAKDKEVKQMIDGVTDIKNIFQELEKNYKFTNDRKSRHIHVLREIISSIKGLTFFKIAIVSALSVLQVFIIRKFFGPDKRVTNVGGAFADKL